MKPELETKKCFKDKKDDPGFLVVKGVFEGSNAVSLERDHRSKLSNAIYMALMNHGYATVRAIGTCAIANAVRSITMASARCRRKGIELYWESLTEKGNLGDLRHDGHVADVTAFLFRVKDFRELGDK